MYMKIKDIYVPKWKFLSTSLFATDWAHFLSCPWHIENRSTKIKTRMIKSVSSIWATKFEKPVPDLSDYCMLYCTFHLQTTVPIKLAPATDINIPDLSQSSCSSWLKSPQKISNTEWEVMLENLYVYIIFPAPQTNSGPQAKQKQN